MIRMWKNYSVSYIKNNRASSISIIVAAFISAFLLSFLCSLFYNFWLDEVKGIVLDEGDWQARVVGNLTSEDMLFIQNFGNVEKAVVNEELSEEIGKVAVDIYFENARTIFEDMPLIARQLGLLENSVSYHISLLSRYFIHDPQDETPPLLMTFYLGILLVVSLSLILIIRNSFAMSMNARIHQFGIFSSIGATPRQIRTCLIQEAAMLCAAPILLGSIMGIVLSIGTIGAMNRLAVTIPGGYASDWAYHPLVFAVVMFAAVLTVLTSAWLPARKLSKLTPLKAIYNTNELRLKKKKHSRILSFLFGIEGELVGNALTAQKKAMRTSTLSLTLSFLGFTLILCFFTLSGISTNHTYFTRYQDAWDVMAVIKDTKIENFGETEELRELTGVKDLLVYQKAKAVSLVMHNEVSQELSEIGGLEAVAGDLVKKGVHSWSVKAPVIILDDEGFLNYCEKSGITPRLDGTVIMNRIWDSINSNFRYKNYIPFVMGEQETITLQSIQQPEETAEIPVLGYVQEAPILREEYENYSLVQFIPISLWKTISGQIGSAETDTYVRILADEGIELHSLQELQHKAENLLRYKYKTEIENRIQEKITNDDIIFAYQLILGGLCSVLALIGIANVFSNTLGFLRQRKREFAQYMSVGMTPSGMRKMFCIEALVIAGRPILITLPLTVAIIGYMIKISYLNPMEFIVEAPITLIIIFCFVIFCFVACAYYLAFRKVRHYNLADALRDDTIA